MALKDLLGDAYREGMTLEEVEAALSDKNLVDATTLSKKVDKDLYDKKVSELAAVNRQFKELQSKLKELQSNSMTAEEKLKAEQEKAAELQRTYAKELSKLKAKEVFIGAGLTEKDFASLLDAVVSEEEETTVARANALIDVINAQKQATEKAVKAELIKSTPTPPPGSAGGAGLIDYDKQIEEARARGDMAAVAALIRQQAMSEKK